MDSQFDGVASGKFDANNMANAGEYVRYEVLVRNTGTYVQTKACVSSPVDVGSYSMTRITGLHYKRRFRGSAGLQSLARRSI